MLLVWLVSYFLSENNKLRKLIRKQINKIYDQSSIFRMIKNNLFDLNFWRICKNWKLELINWNID